MASIFSNKVTDPNTGIIYYLIPKNTTLYRGDSKIDFIPDKLPRHPLFFGLNEKDVEQYGIVYRYKTRKPLTLVALDTNNDGLYNNIPANNNEVKQILRDQYGFYDKENRRDSDNTKDNKIVKFLCENGFEGYANDEMTHIDASRGDFHKEIVICDTSNIEYDGKVEISKELEEQKRYSALLQKVEDPKKKRKSRKLSENYSPEKDLSFTRNLFASPDKKSPMKENIFLNYDSPPASYSNNLKSSSSPYANISRTLFGGKWSKKYKKSINCKKPKGFSQKQYCKYGKRSKNKTNKNKTNKNKKGGKTKNIRKY